MRRLDNAVQDRIETLAATCRAVLARFDALPITAVFLYGSALTSGFRADSDVDIAVLDDGEKRLSWPDQARLMDALERATGHALDLRMLRDSSLSHQANVLEQGLLLWPLVEPPAVKSYSREILAAAREEHLRVARDWSVLLARLAGSVAARR
jgi:predicted nucleotidyltransferase